MTASVSPYLLTAQPTYAEVEDRRLAAARDARWRFEYHRENLRMAERLGSRAIAFRSLDGMAVARRQLQIAKHGFGHARTSPIWRPRPGQRVILWNDAA